jgi:hypothetical protein
MATDLEVLVQIFTIWLKIVFVKFLKDGLDVMGIVGRCKADLVVSTCLLLHNGCCYRGWLLELQICILWKKRVVFLIVD